MEIANPIFQIPDSNNRKAKKIGRRGPPTMRISGSKFRKHRADRVRETKSIIAMADSSEKPIISSEDRLFYEVQFNEKALSKTTQPRILLEKNHIDVYAQISERTFLASSTTKNLKSFCTSIDLLTVGKNKNDSAYLSAVSKIDIIKKDDKLTFSLAEKDKFKAYLFLADVLSEDEGKKVAQEVKQKSGVETEYFISESGAKVVYGSFEQKFIDKISENDPRNPIVRIEKSVEFFPSQELPVEYDLKDATIADLDLDARVAVVDTGIFSHQLLNSLIIGVEDCINDTTKEDLSHGTFVAGRTVFGNDIETQINNHVLTPKAKVLDVRVLKKGGLLTSDKEIIAAVIKVVKDPQYSGVKVFNMSINDDNDVSLRNGEKSFFTRELDSIAYKYKVFIIVTAGNHRSFTSLPYPECFNNPNSIITCPGDMVNGFSVGAIADTESSRALALINEPSPFTRTGIDGQKKPDLVHFGGNCDTRGNCSGVGVKSLSTSPQKIEENIGTSFAAPLVSSVAAQIYAYLKSVGKDSIDLTKALLLHSASYNLPTGSRINPQDLPRLVGFGVPDFNRALNCAESAATFFYIGKIEAAEDQENQIKEYKHKLKFIVPPELAVRGKNTRIRGTLVYTPLISEIGQQDYTLADVDVNLHYKNSKGKDKSAGLTSESNDYRTKWNTVKSFEKIFSNSTRGKYTGGDWEIWITLTTRGRADIRGYVQEYALVITVEDATTDATQKINLSQIIREQYSTYVPVNQQVQTRIQIQ